jgi:hypothetical protein
VTCYHAQTVTCVPALPQLLLSTVQAQPPVLSFGEIEAELQLRGDWLPLMHLYPQNTTHSGKGLEPPSEGLSGIPWSEADQQLQAWLEDSPEYQRAMAEWYP